MSVKNTDVSYLVAVLKSGEYTGGDLMRAWCKLRDQKSRIKELEEIVKAVAHIGIDFGYGKFELDQTHIDKARKLYEAADSEKGGE